MGPGEASGVAGITPFDPERIADRTVKVGRGALGTEDRRDVPPDYSGVTGVEPPSEIYRDPIMDIAAEQKARENALQGELEDYRDPIMDMVDTDDGKGGGSGGAGGMLTSKFDTGDPFAEDTGGLSLADLGITGADDAGIGTEVAGLEHMSTRDKV